MEVFAEQLQQLRRKAGMSQEELAERLDISRQTLSKWEQGVSSPDIEKAIALCKIFEVSLDMLVNGEQCEARTTATGAPVERKGPEPWVWEIFWIAMFVCGNAMLIGSFYVMATSFVILLALGMIFVPIIIFSVKGILRLVRSIKTHKMHN